MDLFAQLKDSIIEMDSKKTLDLTEKAIEEGLDPMDILDKGLVPGIEVVGEQFKIGELFLPEVMASAKAFKNAFEILSSKLKNSNYEPRARVILGSVEGDIHDIGKNIVVALLQGNGYEVHDAGVSVSPQKFVEMARDLKPNAIGMSALLTTTMAKMEDTVKALEEAGLRDSIKVIIGGSCVSEDFAKQIGADAFGQDATEAVNIMKNITSN